MTSTVTHQYGWRPSLPDHRDRYYSAPASIVAKELPPSVDLDAGGLPAPFDPPFNQGQLGSCGPNAAAGDIVFALIKQQGLTGVPMPSRLFIYYNTRVLMGTVGQDSGVDNRTLMKALAGQGWCDETLWPYEVDRYTQKPPQACYDQGTQRRIDQYLAVAQDLTQMKACLAAGDPFVFGFTVYQNMETAAVAATGDVPMPSGRVLGGHDVMFVGYDDATQRFKLRNSWGSWGRGGYGTIPYAYAINPRLSSDFWTVKHSSYPGPVPPVPPNPPTPGQYVQFGHDYVNKVVKLPTDWSATHG